MFIRKIFRILPRLYNEFWKLYNPIKLRLMGASIGKKAYLIGPIYALMMPNSRLTIGNNFSILSGGGRNPLGRNIRQMFFLAKNAEVTIGDNTGISCSVIRCKQKISIGSNVNVGADCIIMDTDAHSLDYRIRNGSIMAPDGSKIDGESAACAPIVIEDDVLIGARSIILKGVTIGARTVIGAGSVVAKSIPPDCIAAGNPAKVIKNINHAVTEIK